MVGLEKLAAVAWRDTEHYQSTLWYGCLEMSN